MIRPVYYTVKELADLWRCPMSTIYKLINTNRLQAFKVGVSWRITDDARLAYEGRRAV